MPTTLFPRLLALLLTVLVIGLVLTTYTLPNHGGGAYWDLHGLISHALGDRKPPLPGPPSVLPVRPVDSTLVPWPDTGLDSVDIRQPGEWIARAARGDSAALREWLGAAVLATATVHGDTVRTTLWRLTLHHACPLLSRMRATSVGRLRGETRVVALTADCPGLTEESLPEH
jgi:hypothetical protein